MAPFARSPFRDIFHAPLPRSATEVAERWGRGLNSLSQWVRAVGVGGPGAGEGAQAQCGRRRGEGGGRCRAGP